MSFIIRAFPLLVLSQVVFSQGVTSSGMYTTDLSKPASHVFIFKSENITGSAKFSTKPVTNIPINPREDVTVAIYEDGTRKIMFNFDDKNLIFIGKYAKSSKSIKEITVSGIIQNVINLSNQSLISRNLYPAAGKCTIDFHPNKYADIKCSAITTDKSEYIVKALNAVILDKDFANQ